MNFKFNDRNSSKIARIAKFLLIAGIALAALFVFFNYLFIWFLPFIIAWSIALLIQPFVTFLNEKLKLPEKPAVVLILLILFVLAALLIFFLFDRILYELSGLSKNFNINTDKISEVLNNFFVSVEKFMSKIPLLSNNDVIEILRVQTEKMAANFANDIGVFIASKIPAMITSVVMFLPSFLIFTIILIVSTFYISLDFKNINRFIMIQIPEKVQSTLIDIKNRFLEAIYKYFRAYTIIILITYFELAAGLLIIGVKYAFVIAGIIAVVDILPVLGAGAVLIPWGIISIIQKDYFMGFGILILYATITVIRQIIEPKIIGKSIGLYPVVTLIALYTGYNALGVFGMFIFPIAILLIKNLNEEGKIHLWKNLKKENKTVYGKKRN